MDLGSKPPEWPQANSSIVGVLPGGSHMLLAHRSRNSIWRMNISSGRVDRIYPAPQPYAPTTDAGWVDGDATVARWDQPFGMVLAQLNGSSVLLVADGCTRIRMVWLNASDDLGRVITIAGTGRRGYRDGVGAQAMFGFPIWMAAEQHWPGIIYVADSSNHVLRRVLLGPDAHNTEVSTFAGTAGRCGSRNGIRGWALLCFPTALAMSQDSLYFVHNGSNTIRALRLSAPEGCELAEAPANLVNAAAISRGATCALTRHHRDLARLQEQLNRLDAELIWGQAAPDRFHGVEEAARLHTEMLQLRETTFRSLKPPDGQEYAALCARVIDGLTAKDHSLIMFNGTLGEETGRFDGSIAGEFERQDGNTHGPILSDRRYNASQLTVEKGEQLVLYLSEPIRVYGLRISYRALAAVAPQPARGDRQHAEQLGSEREVNVQFYGSDDILVASEIVPAAGRSWTADGSSSGGVISMATVTPVVAASIRLQFAHHASVDEVEVLGSHACSHMLGEIVDYSTDAAEVQPALLLALGDYLYMSERSTGQIRRGTLPVLTELATVQGTCLLYTSPSPRDS
eukprot:TRINITY_DN21716_c0_g1_i1.p1 TRINITY_DN21716_c0_g1~~TRINITY_DN21716_c0_g1_i1.p1  ORF type:complete len:570 (+),score=112.32 TRINITY_DN21716_c0_g1_i1:605-2314(+)